MYTRLLLAFVFSLLVQVAAHAQETYRIRLGVPCSDTVATVTSLPQAQEPVLKVYPNPAGEGYLMVESQEVIGQLTLQDMSGRLVYQVGEAGLRHRISLQQVQPGLYLLRFRQAEGRVYSRKVLIE